VILARFVYKNCLLGEWTPALPDAPMIAPNPKYADRLLGVEFKVTEDKPPEKTPKRSRSAYRNGVVRNG